MCFKISWSATESVRVLAYKVYKLSRNKKYYSLYQRAGFYRRGTTVIARAMRGDHTFTSSEGSIHGGLRARHGIYVLLDKEQAFRYARQHNGYGVKNRAVVVEMHVDPTDFLHAGIGDNKWSMATYRKAVIGRRAKKDPK